MAHYENATHVRTQVTAALLNMMKTRDYPSISISDLAQAAQVSRSSFYRNFTDKDDVVRQHLRHLLERWGADFEAVPGQDFSDSLLRHFYANREFYLLLYRCGLSWMLHEHIRGACRVNAGEPPVFTYAAAAVAGALFGWVDEWISRGMKETPEELKRLSDTIRQGDRTCNSQSIPI